MKQWLKHTIPSFKWTKNYSWIFFLGDGVAGITVAIMLIPQAIAYAVLAGMPPETGLYASLIPIIVYAFFGGSFYLSVGPVAITSILVAQALGPLASGNIALFIQMAGLLAFLEGSIQILMGFFNLGFIFHFLSKPVIYGYISAIAITIIISQLHHIFGIHIEGSEKPFLNIYDTLIQWNNIHYPTMWASLLAITVLLYAKQKLKKHLLYFLAEGFLTQIFPRIIPLLVMIFTIAYIKIFSIEGIALIPNLPQGLPSIHHPFTNWDMIFMLLPIAIYLSLLSFMESITVASTLSQQDHVKIDPNRELHALGLAGIASSFSGGYSISGSLSRSVVNYQSGAKSPLSSFFTALIILIVILFFMPQLAFLPQFILSSVIIIAIYSMVKFSYFLKISKLSKIDSACFLITFLSVFFFGIKHGLFTGIIASIIFYIWITSRPHIAIIGRIKNTEHFRNILRHNVETFPNTLIVRIDENLHFANAHFFENKLNSLIVANKHTKTLIINACNINFIDTSALETLTYFIKKVQNKNIQCLLSEIKGPVMDFLQKTDFIKDIGQKNIFLSTSLALKKNLS